MHLKKLCEKLSERHIPMSYQSLSGLMQLYAKAGKKFVKVAPATYALIEPEPSFDDEDSKRTIVYEIDPVETGGNDA